MRTRCALRRSRAAWLLCSFAVGCSGTVDSDPVQFLASEPAVTAPATTTEAVAEEPDGIHSEVEPSAVVSSSPTAMPSRSAMSNSPFGEADLWMGSGPEPVGLQRALGPRDLPGPFLLVPGGIVGHFRVYDMCGRTEASFRRGGDYGSLGRRIGFSAAQRKHKGCSDKRFFGVASGPWMQYAERYFRWRRDAEQWVLAHRDAHERARGGADLVEIAKPLGFAASERGETGWLTLRFAPADAPLDEVRVVPGSVLVRDGVLRGLVRNWSRQMWAYEVTVTAGEREFGWPLSVQPGEVAPFEIRGWDGPMDPELMGLGVDADMSWHADPSRAFGDYSYSESYSSYPQHRFEVDGEGWDRYADVWTDAEAGRVSVGAFGWQLGVPLIVPDSHPGLADDIETLSVRDLRGYGAMLDGDGRVLEVGPAWVGHSRLVPRSDPDSEPVELSFTDVTELRDGEPDRVELMFWAFEELPETLPDNLSEAKLVDWFHDYDPLTGDFRRYVGHLGGFIVWIGASHPQLDDSMR
ncbi:hypothetical protein [Candidatus Poriferisodalis sp.]|uniref:hypothetical protein n=1 Tax=Candidatus Poriferisodalis sp. TaxID=3101277 RepID=UPI003AF4E8BF